MAACGHVCIMLIFILLLLTGNVKSCNTVQVKRNKFSIAHLNICGLLGKIDMLSLFVTQENFDVFAVSETLLKDSIPSELINIPGYNLERKDRLKLGGGVGIYIKENTSYIRRQEFENVDIEFICLEILSKHTKPYFLCVLYRPPKSSKHTCKNFIKVFDNVLSKM